MLLNEGPTQCKRQIALLQIMIFFTRIFDQKVPLSDTSPKNHLSHFGQVVFDMTDLIVGLFD